MLGNSQTLLLKEKTPSITYIAWGLYYLCLKIVRIPYLIHVIHDDPLLLFF